MGCWVGLDGIGRTVLDVVSWDFTSVANVRGWWGANGIELGTRLHTFIPVSSGAVASIRCFSFAVGLEMPWDLAVVAGRFGAVVDRWAGVVCGLEVTLGSEEAVGSMAVNGFLN